MEVFLQLKARWKLRPHGKMEDGGQNTTSEFEFREGAIWADKVQD